MQAAVSREGSPPIKLSSQPLHVIIPMHTTCLYAHPVRVTHLLRACRPWLQQCLRITRHQGLDGVLPPQFSILGEDGRTERVSAQARDGGHPTGSLRHSPFNTLTAFAHGTRCSDDGDSPLLPLASSPSPIPYSAPKSGSPRTPPMTSAND